MWLPFFGECLKPFFLHVLLLLLEGASPLRLLELMLLLGILLMLAVCLDVRHCFSWSSPIMSSIWTDPLGLAVRSGMLLLTTFREGPVGRESGSNTNQYIGSICAGHGNICSLLCLHTSMVMVAHNIKYVTDRKILY